MGYFHALFVKTRLRRISSLLESESSCLLSLLYYVFLFSWGGIGSWFLRVSQRVLKVSFMVGRFSLFSFLYFFFFAIYIMYFLNLYTVSLHNAFRLENALSKSKRLPFLFISVFLILLCNLCLRTLRHKSKLTACTDNS